MVYLNLSYHYLTQSLNISYIRLCTAKLKTITCKLLIWRAKGDIRIQEMSAIYVKTRKKRCIPSTCAERILIKCMENWKDKIEKVILLRLNQNSEFMNQTCICQKLSERIPSRGRHSLQLISRCWKNKNKATFVSLSSQKGPGWWWSSHPVEGGDNRSLGNLQVRILHEMKGS